LYGRIIACGSSSLDIDGCNDIARMVTGKVLRHLKKQVIKNQLKELANVIRKKNGDIFKLENLYEIKR
jgi:hypothetical protein